MTGSPTELVVATANRAKMKEISAILVDLPVKLISVVDLVPDFSPPEEGKSYRRNAIAKSSAAAQLTDRWAIADDSGLEVKALGGEPGVLSARYAGPDAGDADNIARLLEEMKGVPEDRRQAKFICVIALVSPDGISHFFQGECRGEILTESRGKRGFGYDPIFYLPQYKKTMAELPARVKNVISHRYQALWKLRQYLETRGGILK